MGVERGAVGTDGGAAVEAKDVLLVFAAAVMGFASNEEGLLDKSPKPSRQTHPHLNFSLSLSLSGSLLAWQGIVQL